MDNLKKNIDSSVAGMMLTNPNTVVLFEENVKEMADFLHANDSYLYIDGAK
jgi:glycine dehydrogenase subunit 2